MSENRPKPYLGNPQETIAVLNRYKFAFQKKFGQNFLIDTHVLERILLETDSPYMAPTPFRGKRNNSAYIDYVAQEIADLKGISKEEVIAVTEENAKKLFAIISVENTPTSASGE